MTENYKLYIGLTIVAVIMVVSSFFLQSFPFEILSAKIFNCCMLGVAFILVRRFDFFGASWSFQQAIKDGNIAAAITLAGILIGFAIVISTVS